MSEDTEDGERRSTSGIVIPATARLGTRLVWADVVGVGPNVRTVAAGARVLFDPETRMEVEIGGRSYLLMRERDIHAVATEGDAEAAATGTTGLYLSRSVVHRQGLEPRTR